MGTTVLKIGNVIITSYNAYSIKGIVYQTFLYTWIWHLINTHLEFLLSWQLYFMYSLQDKRTSVIPTWKMRTSTGQILWKHPFEQWCENRTSKVGEIDIMIVSSNFAVDSCSCHIGVAVGNQTYNCNDLRDGAGRSSLQWFHSGWFGDTYFTVFRNFPLSAGWKIMPLPEFQEIQ